MAERLDGTVAFVTGASSGIGEATAKALARQGAAVAVVARRKDRLERLAQEIQEDGGKTFAIEADITDQEQAVSAVEQTVSEFGRLDTVFNNAGVMLLGPIEDAPTEEWERMVDLNVKGLLYVAHAALPHLLTAAENSPRRVADLINTSSVAGRRIRSGAGVYNLTKFGVGAFSEALRQEITGRHVRVSLVEPGAVATELQSHLRDEIREQAAARFEDVQILQSEDIADAVVYIVTRPRAWRSTKSSSGQRSRKDRFDPPGCLPPPGEVDAKKDNRAAQNLVRREALPEQQHARRHADERDQVLVDEHPVGPDLRDTPLPGPEPEGRHQERGVGQGLPGPCAGLDPPGVQEARQGERQGSQAPEQHGVRGHHQRRVPPQEWQGQDCVGTPANRRHHDKEVPEETRTAC